MAVVLRGFAITVFFDSLISQSDISFRFCHNIGKPVIKSNRGKKEGRQAL